MVILIDGSESIKAEAWKTMINFMVNIIDNLRIREDLFRIGVAQFSSSYRKEFYLNEHTDAASVKSAIRNITQMKDGTYIGDALKQVHEFFETNKGSRRQSGISQNLLLITDGESSDLVNDAADRLRGKKIEVFVIGIGQISEAELKYIAGSPDRVFFLDSFDVLKLNRTTLEVIDILCIKPSEQRGKDRGHLRSEYG